MKKVISIVLMICIMLCGCSNEEPKTPDVPKTTDAPTTEPTKEPTQEPTQAPTDSITETPSDDGTGFEDVDKLLSEINNEIDASKKETDKANYDTLVSYIQIALTDSRIYEEPTSELNGYIRINNEGLAFLYISDNVANVILETIGSDRKYLTTTGEYYIQIEKTDKGITVNRIYPPE